MKQQPADKISALLGALFNANDSAETIRQLCLGVSGHQKLDLLASLVRLLGFESLAVFGDCFDEVRSRVRAGFWVPEPPHTCSHCCASIPPPCTTHYLFCAAASAPVAGGAAGPGAVPGRAQGVCTGGLQERPAQFWAHALVGGGMRQGAVGCG